MATKAGERTLPANLRKARPGCWELVEDGKPAVTITGGHGMWEMRRGGESLGYYRTLADACDEYRRRTGKPDNLCPSCRAPIPVPSAHDDVDLCSPCRAWLSGSVEVTVSPLAMPHIAGKREGPNNSVPAIQRRLDDWAAELEQAAANARVLAEQFRVPPEESVAHAFMGDGDAPRVTSTETPNTFTLRHLHPDVARRLVENCALADGPEMSASRLLRLRERDRG